MRDAARAVALLLAVTGSGAEAGPRVSAFLGTEWSSGRYGERSTTTIVDSAVTLKLRAGGWTLAVTSTHVAVDGVSDVASAEGGDTDDAAGPLPRRRSRDAGPGDTTLAVSHDWTRIAGSPAYLTAQARVRFPTGDLDKGLGVGARDYMLAGEAGLDFERGGVSAKLTRRLLGDTRDYARRDGWQIEAGAWHLIGRTTTIGADYERRASAFPGGTALRDVDAYVVVPLARRLRLQITGTIGLSRTAAARALGATLLARL